MFVFAAKTVRKRKLKWIQRDKKRLTVRLGYNVLNVPPIFVRYNRETLCTLFGTQKFYIVSSF
jgi:hypothetical protein